MKIHEIKGLIQSTYLIEEERDLLLIDSGCYCDHSEILRVTKELHPKKLQLIALSHNHPDHCGGAEVLRKATNCQVRGPEGIHTWYKGLNGTLTYWIDIALTYYVAYRMKKSLFRRVLFNSKVSAQSFGSEATPLPEFPSWTAIKTPGHTPLDTCFFHKTSETLYVGDLLILNRGKLIRPYPIYEPANYVQSLRKIIELKPKRLLMAHGGIYAVGENFNQQLETLCRFTSQIPRTHHNLLKIFSKRFFKF